MKMMRAVQISRPNGPFELVEKEIPKPSYGHVRIRVQACGICHSDSFTVEGTFPGLRYPRVPGHEIAGVIDEIGEGVTGWSVGQKVGVGWCGGYCGHCNNCRRGDFILCDTKQIPGITFDGGYADYAVVPVSGLALRPDSLTPIEAAPLMCAGITTFNALRNSGAKPGDLVAILGIGGLGHLAIEFAVKMGFHTVAIARGKDKETLAKNLGAHHYIDSEANKISTSLQKLGGAKIILATVTNASAMQACITGLGAAGKLLIVGASAEPLQVSPLSLIGNRLSISGWPSGTSIDSQDTMSFCALTGVRSMNEVFPLEKVSEAYGLMMSGKARFRVVLSME